MTAVAITINGERYEREIEPRMMLSDFIRHEARLTGTHVGCEHGVCGACTIQYEGRPVRSCLMLAVQAHERKLRTVEALAGGGGDDDELHPLQAAFHECHALQCGFCTPGFLMTLEPMLGEIGALDDDALRERLSGNLCRCTGYGSILEAARLAHRRVSADALTGPPDTAADDARDVDVVVDVDDALDVAAGTGVRGPVRPRWAVALAGAAVAGTALAVGAALRRRRRQDRRIKLPLPLRRR